MDFVGEWQEFCANWFADPGMNEVIQQWRRPQRHPAGAVYAAIPGQIPGP